MKTILIAGGTGFVGKSLKSSLIKKGFQVKILTRKPSESDEYFWDPYQNKIDKEALTNVDTLINLCGAGIADERWTEKRKQELYDSRILTTKFLASLLDDLPNLNCYVTASGITCYGFEDRDKPYQETDLYGKDYISQLVKNWEEASALFSVKCRVVQMRISVVLDKEGGALEKMSQSVRMGFGSALGSGKQIVPWIHRSDLVNAFLNAILNDSITGPYNLVAGNDTNQYFMKSLASALKKPFWMPNVPAFVLKIILGEMSIIVLKGVKVSNQKLLDTGFQMEHTDFRKTLNSIYSE